MKKIAISVFAILTAISVNAFAKAGSACGLTDSKDETWAINLSMDLSTVPNSYIHRIPKRTKQQIIITAKEFSKHAEHGTAINNTIDAVNYLRQFDGPYIEDIIVNDVIYTEVRTYPGDNPVGLIFKHGSTTIVAENGDDSITCR